MSDLRTQSFGTKWSISGGRNFSEPWPDEPFLLCQQKASPKAGRSLQANSSFALSLFPAFPPHSSTHNIAQVEALEEKMGYPVWVQPLGFLESKLKLGLGREY